MKLLSVILPAMFAAHALALPVENNAVPEKRVAEASETVEEEFGNVIAYMGGLKKREAEAKTSETVEQEFGNVIAYMGGLKKREAEAKTSETVEEEFGNVIAYMGGLKKRDA